MTYSILQSTINTETHSSYGTLEINTPSNSLSDSKNLKLMVDQFWSVHSWRLKWISIYKTVRKISILNFLHSLFHMIGATVCQFTKPLPRIFNKLCAISTPMRVMHNINELTYFFIIFHLVCDFCGYSADWTERRVVWKMVLVPIVLYQHSCALVIEITAMLIFSTKPQPWVCCCFYTRIL